MNYEMLLREKWEKANQEMALAEGEYYIALSKKKEAEAAEEVAWNELAEEIKRRRRDGA